MAQTTTVAGHLLARLQELGCSDVFGVPGDFTLTLLDHVVAAPGLRWVGCANELNADYAADGYARLRGIGALVTTFGVGELSAANAVAGSYAEHVPVVHVVGAPSLAAQAGRRAVHHSLGDGDFRHFARMAADITVAQAALTPPTAVAEVDRVLAEVRDLRLPGYLLLPVDVVDAPVPAPTAPLPPPADPTDEVALAAFTDAAERLLRGAGRVTVLADLLVHRLRATAELQALLDAGDLPHATLLWGKSLVDESHPRFVGTYTGAVSPEEVREAVEDADVTICAGVQFTDMTSGFFTHRIERVRTVVVGATRASVGGATFEPVSLPAALGALTSVVAARRTPRPSGSPGSPGPRAGAPAADTPAAPPALADDDAALTQDVTWDLVASLLTPGNVVLADTGTAFYGMAAHRLPRGVTFLGQPMWSSIGYALPATLGAGLAEPGRRGVLLIGDGAAQLTVQELGTLLRHRLTPVVVVVNNDGYTVERAIHGQDAPYNDIAPWRWTLLPALFGDDTAVVARVTTVGQLRAALRRAAATPDRLVLVEVVLPRLDVPPLLAALARAAAAANQPAPVTG